MTNNRKAREMEGKVTWLVNHGIDRGNVRSGSE